MNPTFPKAFATLALPFVLILALAAPSQAAAYTKEIYPPNRISSSKIEGWGNLSRSCSGIYGCWNYMKIERNAGGEPSA